MAPKFDKIVSSCSFTIHTVNLPAPNNDAFQIEWTRGESKGMTDRMFMGPGNVIAFEKQFRAPVTIYHDAKSDTVRPKTIAFCVFVYKDSKKKTYGKFLIDVGKYYNKTYTEPETFPVDTPHSANTTVLLSIVTSSHVGPDGAPLLAAEDLTSMADAQQLMTDKDDDWDVSEAVAEECKAKLQSFLDRRKEENEQRVKLSQLARPPKAPVPRRERLQPLAAKASSPQFRALPASKGRPVRSVGSAEVLPVAPALEAPPEEPKPEPSPVSLGRLTPDSVLQTLRQVLDGRWGRSPLDAMSFPGPSAVIYAALTHLSLFDPAVFEMMAFQTIVSEFLAAYRGARMVDDQTPYDSFLVSIYLYKVFAAGTGFENERNEFFKHSLLVVVRDQFGAFVGSFLPQFKAIVDRILDTTLDPAAAADQMMERLEDCFRKFMLPSQVALLCQAELVRHIDAHLASVLIRESARCTFGRAMEWNSAITTIGSQSHLSNTEIPLDLFREAVSVVMMSSVLCADPAAAADFIPHLKPAAILSILAGQKPDDVNPMQNDVTLFASHFKLDPGNIPKREIEREFEGNFEEVLEVIGADWKAAKVKQDDLDSFRFLMDLFGGD
jgi:hypothetical protein